MAQKVMKSGVVLFKGKCHRFKNVSLQHISKMRMFCECFANVLRMFFLVVTKNFSYFCNDKYLGTPFIINFKGNNLVK